MFDLSFNIRMIIATMITLIALIIDMSSTIDISVVSVAVGVYGYQLIDWSIYRLRVWYR